VVDVSDYLQAEVYADETISNTYAVTGQDLLKPGAPKLPQIQQLSLEIDSLTLQVSDDDFLIGEFEQRLLDQIERMESDMDESAPEQSSADVEVQIIMGSTVSITAGIVSWVLRGGSLLASLMSTVPLLNRFDPLPIFRRRREDESIEPNDDDDDSEVLKKEHARRVDNMFSGTNEQQQRGRSIDE
jgi:hypothetical protein